MHLTSCRGCKHSFYFGYTRIDWLPVPQTPALSNRSHKPSPSPQNSWWAVTSLSAVHCSTTRMESALLLLNPRSVNWIKSLVQNLKWAFSRRLRVSPLIIESHPLVHFFKSWNHHQGLSVHRHCPQPPQNTEEACWPNQRHNVQRPPHLRVNLIHLAFAELLDYLGDLH